MLGAEDTPEAIERAKTYVASAAPAIEGEGGDHQTYKVCVRLRRDFNLSVETALEVLDPWNARCVPPWDLDDLTKKLENAEQYGQNLAGTDNPLIGLEPVEPPPLHTSKFLASISTYRNTREDDAAAPRLPWLAPGRLMRRNLTVLFAPGATGKSLLMLEWAVAAALGPSALGASDFCGLNARERCSVLVINAEDETSVMEQRLGAICDAFEIPRNEVWGRIRLQSGKDRGSFRFKVAVKNTKNGAIEPTPEVDEIIAYCKAYNIDVVIVDPLIRTHPANENDNGEMQQVADIFERIAAETNAAVVLPHHTKKPGRGGYSEFAGSPDAGRGASAIKDASRVALTLFPMSEADGEEFNVPAHIRHRYVRLDDAKMNFGLAGPEAQWFVKRTVQTANGDETGVLVPVMIGARAEVEPTAEQLERVYEYLCGVTVSNEWQRLSADPQAQRYLPRQTGILPGAEDDAVPGIIEAALYRLKNSARAELVPYGRPNKAGKIPERWRAIIK
ncbi:helicase RepA family protein [Hyphomicrobium sp. MC1]|uniref:AAA family ATPase n=1 Tax=Hyphomicrobium sp. (strain MC1) TaxID=717785 RepID=UPI001FCB45FB|nr:helicase RepA family protein [Hyphomicrobium sp. MC1]